MIWLSGLLQTHKIEHLKQMCSQQQWFQVPCPILQASWCSTSQVSIFALDFSASDLFRVRDRFFGSGLDASHGGVAAINSPRCGMYFILSRLYSSTASYRTQFYYDPTWSSADFQEKLYVTNWRRSSQDRSAMIRHPQLVSSNLVPGTYERLWRKPTSLGIVSWCSRCRRLVWCWMNVFFVLYLNAVDI